MNSNLRKKEERGERREERGERRDKEKERTKANVPLLKTLNFINQLSLFSLNTLSTIYIKTFTIGFLLVLGLLIKPNKY